jgi:hypothetical protein
MKSKLLLVSLLSSALALTAQKAETATLSAVKNNSMFTQGAYVNTAGNSSREVVWSNDFSVPADWTITNEISSGAGADDNWVIGTNGPAGSFAIADIQSTSAANGFALFDSDLLCSTNGQIANLTTTNMIDCSAYSELVVEFEQQYRRFYDSTFVFVSNNGGTTWDKYYVNRNLTNNDAVPTNPTKAKVYVTPTAAGQDSVMIRFQFYSPTSINALAGCAYSWMIDDVALVVPPANDLVLNNIYVADIVNDYEMGIIAISQADSINSTVTVTNEGFVPQNTIVNYNIRLAGNSVASGSMPGQVIAPFETVNITALSNYVPTAVGVYTIEINVTSDSIDATPDNNQGANTLTYTQNQWTAVQGLDVVGDVTQAGETAPYDPFKVGQFFFVKNPVSLRGFDVAVARLAAVAASAEVELQLELFTAADLNTPLTIESFFITTTHPLTPTWFTIGLSSPYDLTATSYMASVGNLDSDKQFNFYAQGGDADAGTLVYGPFGANAAINWFTGWDYSPAIGLNFDETIGFNDVNNGDLLSVAPNPANDQLTINLTLNNASSINVNLIDINGKVVFNKNVKGNVLAYKDILTLSDFANGIYTLQVESKNGLSSQKVVIAH